MIGNGVLIPDTPIAIDYWRERQCNQSKLFFLSHYHADHMEGLNSSWSLKIYCSEITASLLIHEMSIRSDLVVSLQIGQPHVIPVDEMGCETMSVTLLDANHCPGAVMFLFEGYFGCILYTGDFRYDDQLHLQPGFPQSKQVDQLFLDNTYCNPKAQFPTRHDAFQIILNIIQQNPTSNIIIGLTHLGKEKLLEQLAVKLQTMIVVDSKRMQRLNLLGCLNVFTDQMDMGRIIVKYKNEITDSTIERWNQQSGPTIAIIPTALYIYQDRPPILDKRIYVVHYSDHSNYNELRQFVSVVKPCRITPIIHHIADTALGESWNDMTCFKEFCDQAQPRAFTVPVSVAQFMYGYNQAGQLVQDLRNSNDNRNTLKRKYSKSNIKKRAKHGRIEYQQETQDDGCSGNVTSSTDETNGQKTEVDKQIDETTKTKNEDDILLNYALLDEASVKTKSSAAVTPDRNVNNITDQSKPSIINSQESIELASVPCSHNVTTVLFTDTETDVNIDDAPQGDDKTDVNTTQSSQKSHCSNIDHIDNYDGDENVSGIGRTLILLDSSKTSSNNDTSEGLMPKKESHRVDPISQSPSQKSTCQEFDDSVISNGGASDGIAPVHIDELTVAEGVNKPPQKNKNKDNKSDDEIMNSFETDRDKYEYHTPPTSQGSGTDSGNNTTNIQSIDEERKLPDTVNQAEDPFFKPLTKYEWSQFLQDVFQKKKALANDISSWYQHVK